MKTAFVTGGSRGIGSAIALALGKTFHVVVGFANSEDKANDVVKEIEIIPILDNNVQKALHHITFGHLINILHQILADLGSNLNGIPFNLTQHRKYHYGNITLKIFSGRLKFHRGQFNLVQLFYRLDHFLGQIVLQTHLKGFSGRKTTHFLGFSHTIIKWSVLI